MISDSFFPMLAYTLLALLTGLVMMQMRQMTIALKNSTQVVVCIAQGIGARRANQANQANQAAHLQALPAPDAQDPPPSEADFYRVHSRVSRLGTNQHKIRVKCLDCGREAEWHR